jgi:hypothetical protein
MSEETKHRGYLTNYTETSVETGRQLSREPYLYGVLGLVAVVVLGVDCFSCSPDGDPATSVL